MNAPDSAAFATPSTVGAVSSSVAPPVEPAQPLTVELAAKGRAAQAVLARIAVEAGPAVFTTSFGAEDMVVFDLIGEHGLPESDALRTIAVATLDTGRLPDETYQVWQRAVSRYRRKVESFFPEAEAVERFVRFHGINAFYDSIAERKACCHIRKVEPLARALAGRRAWITGLRRSQAASRSDLEVVARDDERDLLKVSPLADRSEAEVWAWIRARDVPVNALHARGFPSIGCAPCTRAVAPGEDLRAGRWWWESADAKECGLHTGSPLEAVVT